MNLQTINENELISLLKQGKREGFDYLYHNYSKALYGVLLRILNDHELAEDSLQEVFVKIWKNINQYDESKGKLYTWMLQLTRNSGLDVLRSKSFQNQAKNQNLSDSVSSIEQQTQVKPNIDFIGVKELTKSLRKDQKVLIDLIYFEGYTQEEAAKKIGIPLGTVKTRIRAAMLILRNIFNQNEKAL